MNGFAEFMDKVMADEAASAEFDAVISVRKEREFTDDDFQKIVGISEKLGAAVTLDEVKEFFTGNGRELSEEELAGVAGGGAMKWMQWQVQCPVCGEQIDCKLPYMQGGKLNVEDAMNYAVNDICVI